VNSHPEEMKRNGQRREGGREGYREEMVFEGVDCRPTNLEGEIDV